MCICISDALASYSYRRHPDFARDFSYRGAADDLYSTEVTSRSRTFPLAFAM
jgi:hypothetical protein